MILRYYKSSDGRSWAITKDEYEKRVAEIEAEIRSKPTFHSKEDQ